MTINEKGETQRFRSDIMEDMVKDEYFNIFQGRQDCYGVRSRESFTIRKKDQKKMKKKRREKQEKSGC